jgi:hypothetical protein
MIAWRAVLVKNYFRAILSTFAQHVVRAVLTKVMVLIVRIVLTKVNSDIKYPHSPDLGGRAAFGFSNYYTNPYN